LASGKELQIYIGKQSFTAEKRGGRGELNTEINFWKAGLEAIS